jgi:integrase
MEMTQIDPSIEMALSNQETTLSLWLNNPYIHAATSQNTRIAYQSDIRHFEKSGGKLPATSEMIIHYLQFFAEKLNSRTLARRIVALKHWHSYQGFPDPTQHPAVQKTMTGIQRIHGKPKEKAPAIKPEEIALIHQYLINQESLSALRDDALLLIGFFGALRRSELVAIQFEHIKWDEAGIEILLPTSKTDQTHAGQYSAIPYGNETICPVRSLKTWLEVSNIKQGAIFRRIMLGDHLKEDSLTPLSVNNILKKRALESGLENAEYFSAHSLRRGLATSAAKSGASLQAIMRAGRWKQTNTVMEYIEASERFTDNVASNILHAIQQK